MDDVTAAAIKSIKDLTDEVLRLLGHGSSHTDNTDQGLSSEVQIPALEVGADGVLRGAGCSYIPTQKRGHLAKATNGKVRGIVWHYTDTGAAPGSAIKLAQRLAQPGGRQASWHILIGRDGTIIQSIPLTLASWHAGSETAGKFLQNVRGIWRLHPKGGVGANSLFAGVELECVGEVRKVGDQWRGWPFGKPTPDGSIGVRVSGDEVVEAKDATGRVRFWHGYTPAQELAAERVVMAIDRWADLDHGSCALSHQMIDPDRRTDPGPVWMDQVLPRVLGRVFE